MQGNWASETAGFANDHAPPFIESFFHRQTRLFQSALPIDVQQSNAMVYNRFCRKTGLPLVGLVALLF
jgi:hypothetical protein